VIVRVPGPGRATTTVGPVSDAEKYTTEISTVLAWHDALNAGDEESLLQVSSDDVELSGPEGSRQGTAALREWAADADVRLEPGRTFVHHGVVVVEEDASWSGGGSSTVASAFRVVGHEVVSVFRHADLAAALAATGLGDEDEVTDR
jgi:hypothetical protein